MILFLLKYFILNLNALISVQTHLFVFKVVLDVEQENLTKDTHLHTLFAE